MLVSGKVISNFSEIGMLPGKLVQLASIIRRPGSTGPGNSSDVGRQLWLQNAEQVHNRPIQNLTEKLEFWIGKFGIFDRWILDVGFGDFGFGGAPVDQQIQAYNTCMKHAGYSIIVVVLLLSSLLFFFRLFYAFFSFFFFFSFFLFL